jgi:beta-glucanase (GH16 family)
MSFISRLKVRFGMIPQTQSIEETRAALQKEYEEYLAFGKSKELKHYEELQGYVTAPEFAPRKKEIMGQKFQQTDEFQKEKRYKELAKSAIIRKYNKVKGTEKEAEFLQETGTVEIDEFQQLEKFVNSEAFSEVKRYMALPGKNKFDESEEGKKLAAYNELKKSEKIVWYYSLDNTKKFDEIKRWKLTFEDDFDANKLDNTKWLTKYFYGEAILNASYTLQNDQHFVTDGENIELDGSNLRIVTKKEETEGRAWHPKYGFHTKKFDYTSGVVNTAPIFRQQYGKFEAKIKFAPGVGHTFWMAGDKALPQVDVIKYNNNKISMGLYDGELKKKAVKKQLSNYGGSKYTTDYHIFTLEWTPDKMKWKINGLEAKAITGNMIPSALYIALSSGLYNGKINDEELPVAMEVDWVKCYEKNPNFAE